MIIGVTQAGAIAVVASPGPIPAGTTTWYRVDPGGNLTRLGTGPIGPVPGDVFDSYWAVMAGAPPTLIGQTVYHIDHAGNLTSIGTPLIRYRPSRDGVPGSAAGEPVGLIRSQGGGSFYVNSFPGSDPTLISIGGRNDPGPV